MGHSANAGVTRMSVKRSRKSMSDEFDSWGRSIKGEVWDWRGGSAEIDVSENYSFRVRGGYAELFLKIALKILKFNH